MGDKKELGSLAQSSTKAVLPGTAYVAAVLFLLQAVLEVVLPEYNAPVQSSNLPFMLSYYIVAALLAVLVGIFSPRLSQWYASALLTGVMVLVAITIGLSIAYEPLTDQIGYASVSMVIAGSLLLEIFWFLLVEIAFLFMLTPLLFMTNSLGEWWSLLVFAAVGAGAAHYLRRLAHFHMVTKYQEQQTDAEHDLLTGLYNRRGFLERAYGRGRKNDTANRTLYFVDIDKFKVINDTYGHETGDEVLRLVAKAIASSVRAGDLVARWGGDEFVVLWEGVDYEVSVFVKQVNDKLEELHKENFQIVLSIGSAVVSDDIDNAVRLADNIMYAEKIERRKKVEY